MYYYVIIERSWAMVCIGYGFGTMDEAWAKANKLYSKYPQLLEDYDVLFFDTEQERIEFIIEQARRDYKVR